MTKDGKQESGDGTPDPGTPSDAEKRGISTARDGATFPGREAPEAPFPIVGIGASAGGLEALEVFFDNMPPEPDMAFVVVQHLAPERPTIMPELLARRTKLPVQLAEDGTRIAANNVYVIPPNASLAVRSGVLHVKTPQDPRRTPIDAFFRSLADDQGPNAICIVLSGTGADGTLGVKAIKEHGGMAMAQDMESARYDSMPRSAIALGLVDFVLPADRMPSKLVEYVLYPRRTKERASDPEARGEDGADTLRKICSLLHRRTGHDFSQYKPATLLRRIHRRMQVQQVPGPTRYLETLRKDPREVDHLFRDLLIGVTHFFRDPDAFAKLASLVVPELFRDKGAEDSVRVWVSGCATGEEAYSIAILLREHLARIDSAPPVKIFATDIDEQALETARLGRYSEGVAEHVSPERIERFFVRQGTTYQVDKQLREMCIFSVHNVISDPPFSRLDLIACRNLLIYLDSDLQRRLVPLFHYALRPGGHLFLGPSESLAVPELFRVLDKKNRIFQRNDAVLSPPLTFPPVDAGRAARLAGVTPRPLPARELGIARVFDRVLLEHFGPPAVIVNDRADVVYTSGRTGKYLELAPGVMNHNVIDMARRTLRPDLYTAFHKALKTGQEVVHEGVTVDVEGQIQRLDLIVRPMPELEPDAGLYLVVFRDVGPLAEKGDAGPAAETARALDPLAQALESELRSTKEHLQTTIEELETSNEELKSTNEELQSTNEELQSTNEELQTSKEELQSINEELQTVNLELSRKVDELDRANSDLQNLFAATQIATIFVDRELRIKKFSAAAKEVFRIIESDVGRPITDIAATYADGDLASDVREVLTTLRTKERQVSRPDTDTWYIQRIRPYRSTDDMIDGAVITFLDVTELTRAQARALGLAAIVESSQDAIIGMTIDGTITSWNKGAERLYAYSAPEVIGQPAAMLRSPSDDLEPLFAQIRAGQDVRPFEAVRYRKGGEAIAMLIALFPVKDPAGHILGMASIGRDITERKRHEKTLEEADRRKNEFLALLGHELRNPLVPIRNAAAVLKQLGVPSTVRPVQMIDRQVSHMTRLIDDLLDLARITTGRVALRKRPIDLVALVRQLLEDWQSRAAAAEVKLSATLPEESLPLVGDPTRLVQAIGNLIHNALKFSSPGGLITVEVEHAADPEAVAIVRVRDSGAGMTPEVLSRLFTPFTPTARSAASGGLGLGLVLAKAMAELHGGTLRGESDGPDKGSVFTIRLPIGEEGVTSLAPAAPPALSPAVPRCRSIVLIEDNIEVAESMADLLELAGHEVKMAHTAEEGIELVMKERPDVVLCDIGLPGDLDGYDVARALRKDPQTASTYCVALSGFGQEADKQRAREAGFDEHVIKPVDPDALERLLASAPDRAR